MVVNIYRNYKVRMFEVASNLEELVLLAVGRSHRVQHPVLVDDPVLGGLPGEDVQQTGLFPERVEPRFRDVSGNEVERLGQDVGAHEVRQRVRLFLDGDLAEVDRNLLDVAELVEPRDVAVRGVGDVVLRRRDAGVATLAGDECDGHLLLLQQLCRRAGRRHRGVTLRVDVGAVSVDDESVAEFDVGVGESDVISVVAGNEIGHSEIVAISGLVLEIKNRSILFLPEISCNFGKACNLEQCHDR